MFALRFLEVAWMDRGSGRSVLGGPNLLRSQWAGSSLSKMGLFVAIQRLPASLATLGVMLFSWKFPLDVCAKEILCASDVRPLLCSKRCSKGSSWKRRVAPPLSHLAVAGPHAG